MTDRTAEGLPDFLTAQRVQFALEASWQAEACTRAALQQLRELGQGDQMLVESVLRALLDRLNVLSGVSAAALNDPDESDTGMAERLGVRS